MQTASEESYRDMTNLQSKLQMHQAFEAELTANQERVEAVQKVWMGSHRILLCTYTLTSFESIAIFLT